MATKITLATFKKFLRDHRDHLLIREESHFDGMVDCVMPCANPTFTPAQAPDRGPCNYNLGVQGIYLVGSSRDYFRPFTTDTHVGIHVFNSCGSFTVAVAHTPVS